MCTNAGRKQRIVMLGTSLDTHGGISAVINNYRSAGLFRRADIIYIATHADGSRRVKLWRALVAWIRFIALLLTNAISLVHAHSASNASFWRKALFLYPAFWRGIPVLFHLHGGGFKSFFQECSPWQKSIIRNVLRRSTVVVSLSTNWRHELLAMQPLANVVTVMNPVMPASGRGVAREAFLILFCGKVCAEKGVFDLLRAFASVAREFRAAKLVICGDGELHRVKSFACSLNIQDRVTYSGWISAADVADFMKRATVLVLPSYEEGLPMVVLEAMANGLPVIATPVGGIPEMLRDEKGAILVKPGDVAQLGEAIRRILGDPVATHNRSMAMSSIARKRFDPHVITSQVLDIYRQHSAV
jgi:glycosyltransferase involved in cell wall biosynthesis